MVENEFNHLRKVNHRDDQALDPAEMLQHSHVDIDINFINNENHY